MIDPCHVIEGIEKKRWRTHTRYYNGDDNRDLIAVFNWSVYEKNQNGILKWMRYRRHHISWPVYGTDVCRVQFWMNFGPVFLQFSKDWQRVHSQNNFDGVLLISRVLIILCYIILTKTALKKRGWRCRTEQNARRLTKQRRKLGLLDSYWKICSKDPLKEGNSSLTNLFLERSMSSQ